MKLTGPAPEVECRAAKRLYDAEERGWSIEVKCKSCQRIRVVPPGPLIRLASIRRWDDDFISVGNRLRCECGAKFPAISATTAPLDGGRPIGPANEEELRKMVREQRR